MTVMITKWRINVTLKVLNVHLTLYISMKCMVFACEFTVATISSSGYNIDLACILAGCMVDIPLCSVMCMHFFI